MRGVYDTPLLFFSRIANVAWPVDRNERGQIFFEGQAKTSMGLEHFSSRENGRGNAQILARGLSSGFPGSLNRYRGEC